MKILCTYHDEEASFLDTDPEVELEGHEVTVFHFYSEAKEVLLDPARGVPAFDVVLADVALPFSQDIDERGSTLLLSSYISQGLVRGFGVFIPDYFSDDSGFRDTYEGYLGFIATKDCWTMTGKRDWQKLLSLVEGQFEAGGFGPA